MDKYRRITLNIQKYLKDKESYEKIDDTLIEELSYNVELSDIAKKDIKANGLQTMMTSTKGHEYYQINPAINVYQSAVKQITAISTKLGITVLNRTQLGLKSAEGEDELDAIQDG